MANYITSYKELLAQREAARAAAAEIKALPELTGSEKQIAWALDIRAKKFENLNKMLADMNANTTDEMRQNQIALQAAKNVLASKTDSRFWIDNRNVEARRLIANNNLQDDLKAEFARLTDEEKNQDVPDAKAEAEVEVEAEEYAITTAALQVATEAEENDVEDELIDEPEITAKTATVEAESTAVNNVDAENESATENDNEKHNERTYITFSVAPYHCEELKQEHFDDIKAELEEITEGKNFRCDAEIGISVVVPVGQAQDSVENILDAYGLNYQRYIFTKDESTTINHDAEVNTATDTNEEIINCTDDIIITDDAYTQMIRAELANAQIASGDYDIEINGERIYFDNHKITRIDAGEFSFEYTLQGRKQFRHNGRVISRDSVIKFFENKETAAAQEKSFREFFIDRNAVHRGFFQVMISPTFADGCEHDYSRYFEYFNQAIDFVNNAIDFCGDVPTHITIKRDKQAGQIYYHRTPDGSVHLDKPDTDFFKYYSAEEIQARIDAINKAIHFNRVFYKNIDSDIDTEGLIAEANCNLEVTRNFYEFVLHENAPATIAETDGSEEDDDDNEVFNLLPSVDELNDVDLTKSAYFDGRADLGYIFKLSVAINRSFDGTRPWTLESIDGNITAEGRTWQDYAKFIITDTDGSEDDDFADEMPALFPAEDSDDEELIDSPATTPADDFEAKLAELKAKQDAAKEKELAAKKVYKEASDKYEECRAATQDFLDAHAEKLTEKIKAIELESSISLVRDNGKERCKVFSPDELYVDAFNAFGEMFIVYCRGNKLGNYDTPAQVETVIERLKTAIDRDDSEFIFPTIEELAKPEVDKDATAGSLTRAMTIALKKHQDYCLAKNLTAATNELKLYNICRQAMTELLRREAA